MDHIVKCSLPFGDTHYIQICYGENPFGKQWEASKGDKGQMGEKQEIDKSWMRPSEVLQWRYATKDKLTVKFLRIHLGSSKDISLRQEELLWNQTTKGKVDKAWKLWLEHLHFCCEEPCFWQGWRRWTDYKRYFEVAAMISEGEVFDSTWQILSLSWISSYPLSSLNSNFNPLWQLDSEGHCRKSDIWGST